MLELLKENMDSGTLVHAVLLQLLRVVLGFQSCYLSLDRRLPHKVLKKASLIPEYSNPLSLAIDIRKQNRALQAYFYSLQVLKRQLFQTIDLSTMY